MKIESVVYLGLALDGCASFRVDGETKMLSRSETRLFLEKDVTRLMEEQTSLNACIEAAKERLENAFRLMMDAKRVIDRELAAHDVAVQGKYIEDCARYKTGVDAAIFWLAEELEKEAKKFQEEMA